MGETKIEWATHTWNPVTGCTRVSRGCDHCYAATLANGRLKDVYRRRLPVIDSEEAKLDPFAIRLWPERLNAPLRWATPRVIFVNSMSDLFHQDIPEEFTLRIFDVMLVTRHHVYQVLTKRPARAARFVHQHRHRFPEGSLPPHIWIGTSVEDQQASFRIRHLRQVPARVRFLSCEPLLGPLELDLREINWVIVGGESGMDYRQMDLDWARAIREQCLNERVPFFFKQVGGRTPKARGRKLDGRTWDETPTLPVGIEQLVHTL